MLQPLFAAKILKWFIETLGFGQQVVLAGIMLFVMFELYRALGFAQRAGSLLTGVGVYLIVILGAFAIAIAADVVDPNPGVAGRLVGDGIDFVTGWLADIVGELVSGGIG